MSDIVLMRGDTATFQLVVTRNNLAVDLTNALIWFTIKVRITDGDNAAVVQKIVGDGIVITSPQAGLATVTLMSNDTNNLSAPSKLYYDVQVKEAGGVVSTVVSGNLNLIADVTRIN